MSNKEIIEIREEIMEYIDVVLTESGLSLREKIDLHDDLIVQIGLNKKEYQVALEDE